MLKYLQSTNKEHVENKFEPIYYDTVVDIKFEPPTKKWPPDKKVTPERPPKFVGTN